MFVQVATNALPPLCYISISITYSECLCLCHGVGVWVAGVDCYLNAARASVNHPHITNTVDDRCKVNGGRGVEKLRRVWVVGGARSETKRECRVDQISGKHTSRREREHNCECIV